MIPFPLIGYTGDPGCTKTADRILHLFACPELLPHVKSFSGTTALWAILERSEANDSLERWRSHTLFQSHLFNLLFKSLFRILIKRVTILVTLNYVTGNFLVGIRNFLTVFRNLWSYQFGNFRRVCIHNKIAILPFKDPLLCFERLNRRRHVRSLYSSLIRDQKTARIALPGIEISPAIQVTENTNLWF